MIHIPLEVTDLIHEYTEMYNKRPRPFITTSGITLTNTKSI